MPGRTSKIGKSMDRADARTAAYQSALNPYQEGTRLHRYFTKERQQFENMEARFRDLETVYGPIGTPR